MTRKTFGGKNMNANKLALLAMLLFTLVAVVAPVHAQTLPLVVEQVQFDDIEIFDFLNGR